MGGDSGTLKVCTVTTLIEQSKLSLVTSALQLVVFFPIKH